MFKAVLIHTLLLFVAFSAAAQKATFEFFTTADGLAGNQTSSVTQDDQGFLWFVNGGKIHRYDGRNFVVYLAPGELSSGQEQLSGLASWQDSLLFVWSEHFTFLFHQKTGNWQPIKIKEDNAKSDGTRFWVGPDPDNILVSKVKKGLGASGILYFPNSQLELAPLSKYNPLLNSYYWHRIDAFDYTLAYQDTLYQPDPSGRITTATILDNVCKECYDLYFQFAPDGALILLANRLFYRLDKNQNTFVPHPANRFLKANNRPLRRFILEKNGNIWACGYDRNLLYYDAVADTLYDFQRELKQLLPNSNDFTDLFRDKTGIVWIGTRLGLLKVRPRFSPFDTYFTGLNQANAYFSFRGFTEDKQGIIYGVYYDGIAKFDPAKKQTPQLYSFTHIPNLFDLYAEDGTIWANSGQLFDPIGGQLKDVPSPFHETQVSDNGFFAKDKQGTLWWAAHYFLYRLQKSGNGLQWTKEMELPEKIFNNTEALHAGMQSGKLWLGFKRKLLQYDPQTKAQRWFDPKDWGVSISRILAIEEDCNGKLWLGTDAGLVHIDPSNGVVQQYTVNDGLPNNFICGLLTEGDSCLWLSTNHGLSRLHIPTSTFINFLEEDGLTYNEFNRKSYFKARNGQMFFGGMRGVNAFFPQTVMQAYRNRGQGAQVVLSALEYTDERRDTVLRETQFASQPDIQVYPWNWSYTFEYALTDYDNPKEVWYSYKMEGYKDSWSLPSKFNFTRFNSLPSGEYIFRVKARDSRGHWQPNELAVKVVVHPPWWATWWACVIYAVVLAGIGLAIYDFLKKRLLLQNELKLGQREGRRLKELDHFKSRLYTNLTHEFRTPLTVILGMVGHIRDQPKKYLEEGTRLIENNSKNLLRLINQLLDLSKLENHSFQLYLRQADIVPYLRYVTESFQTYANSRNLSLRFFTTLESLVVDYDPEQMKQVLTNLISNALKFTPSGGDILVRLTETAGQLRLEVRDTGIGIAEKDLPHVFERFYQVDGSLTRPGEGTGIGLAHTQELMKLMGGKIGVESELGQGSTFTVQLPITKNAPPMAAQARTEDPHAPKIRVEFIENEDVASNSLLVTHHSLPQLLLIEDNLDVVIYLKACLEGLYQLDVAYNGKIGIEKAFENIPDLIISDVMMPEKDGYQVCDALKNDERTSHIPIILLTAKADATSKITGLKRGADAYLIKPFDKEELLVRLEVLVERQKRMVAYFSKINPVGGPATAAAPEPEDAFVLEDAFVQKVREIVAENYADEDFGLPQLCQKISMSRSQLFRKMKAVLDTSPADFIRSYRLTQAKVLLETTPFSVSEVAWQTGYKNRGHFSSSFQEEFGFPPSATSK